MPLLPRFCYFSAIPQENQIKDTPFDSPTPQRLPRWGGPTVAGCWSPGGRGSGGVAPLREKPRTVAGTHSVRQFNALRSFQRLGAIKESEFSVSTRFNYLKS